MKKKKAAAKARSKAVKKATSRKPVKAKAKIKVKKSSSRKPPSKIRVKKKAPAVVSRPGVIAPVNAVLLGLVEDYFAKIGVIALTLKAALAAGQRIQVLGHTTNFEQVVDSLQIDHLSVTQAAENSAVGIKVIGRARRRDHVYLLK